MNKTSQKLNKLNKTIIIAIVLFAWAGETSAGEITRKNVIDLANQSRDEKGIAALEENNNLDQAAEDKAEDMVRNNYFAHISPSGITPWHWIDKNNYPYHFAGENLAINFVNAEKQHRAWMDSEKHRQNILSDRYQEIGVAVRKGMIDGRETIITVQMFGSRDGFTPVVGKTLGAAQESIQEPKNITYRNILNVSGIAWLFAATMALISGMLIIVERRKLYQQWILIEALLIHKNNTR